MNGDIEWLIMALVVLAIVIGLFFLFRFLVLWYYKIDERIEIQYKALQDNKTIITLLEEISDNIKAGKNDPADKNERE
jgi:hypothetical protein